MGYDFGESVLARRTAWMLERYASDDLSEADVVDAFAEEMPVEDTLRRFRVFRRADR